MMESKEGEINKDDIVGNISIFTSELQQFDFTDEAIDVALRKLLTKVQLPKESQLIDQAMEDFAKRYHQCNSTLMDSYDSIYAVAFSILLLHTDAHNKNVKRKMNKDTFIMRAKLIEGGETVFSEVLDIMYDNIVYSEFSYAHDHQDKSSTWFSRKSGQPNITLLQDLYLKLGHLMPAADNFSYKSAPTSTISITHIQQSIEKASPVLLAGVRHRHQQQHQSSGNETFLAKVYKAGIVERKCDLVHGGRRSPARGWRPFGMALTGSQIMFFGDLVSFHSWFNSQQHQQHPTENDSGNTTASQSSATHSTQINHRSPPYLSLPSAPFKSSTPPNQTSLTTFNSAWTSSTVSNLTIVPSSTTCLTNTDTSTPSSASNICLRPTQIVSLSNALCTYDESYRKYPHVYRLITGDGQQFLIRCDSTDEMDDWIQKINYVSAIKTTGVRLRPKTTTQTISAVAAGSHYRKSHRICQHQVDSQQQLLVSQDYHLCDSHHHGPTTTQHWIKHEQKAKGTITSLKEQLTEQQRQLTKDEQLRNQLMLLEPLQKATKDRLLHFAESVGKRLLHNRIALERLACYRKIIELELFYYQSFNIKRERHDDNGLSKRNGQTIGNIPRKTSAPLPFYSRLLYDRQSATAVQQQQQHAPTSHALQLSSLKVSTTNGKNGGMDGDDSAKYSEECIPCRSTNLSGDDDKCEDDHSTITITTSAATNGENTGGSEKLEMETPSTGNRRRSCPQLHLKPLLAFSSEGDDHQQGSAAVENSTACGHDYHDRCYCRRQQQNCSINDSTCQISSQQQQSQCNRFLTTQPSDVIKDDTNDDQTIGCSISDVNTDNDDNDNDDSSNGFGVYRNDTADAI